MLLEMKHADKAEVDVRFDVVPVEFHHGLKIRDCFLVPE